MIGELSILHRDADRIQRQIAAAAEQLIASETPTVIAFVEDRKMPRPGDRMHLIQVDNRVVPGIPFSCERRRYKAHRVEGCNDARCTNGATWVNDLGTSEWTYRGVWQYATEHGLQHVLVPDA